MPKSITIPALVAAVFGLALSLASSALAVTYKVSFHGLWNASQVNLSALPPGAHFTQLVGATHVAGATFWTPGTPASPGVEAVAEDGNPFPLLQEVTPAVNAGDLGGFITVADIYTFPSTTTSTFEITEAHPRVSLISMVAPSPDWFVGVSEVALYNGTSWVPQLSIDLTPWDAGTEDGNAFDLSNPPTSPQGVIANVFDSPFIGQPVIARVEFELLTPLPPSAPEVAVPLGVWPMTILGLLLSAGGAVASRSRLARR
ncbi:MAG: spondin domain-containing protein [Pseudomonadota bacterium]